MNSLFLDEIGRIEPSEIYWPPTARNGCGTAAKRNSDRHIYQRSRRRSFFPRTRRRELCPAWSMTSAIAGRGLVRGFGGSSAYLEANVGESLKLLCDLELYVPRIIWSSTRTHGQSGAGHRLRWPSQRLAAGGVRSHGTPMGARRLRQWLLYPLLDERAIRERQDGVQELVENFSLREELKSGLARFRTLNGSPGGWWRARLAKGSGRDQTYASRVSELRAVLADVNADMLGAAPRTTFRVAGCRRHHQPRAHR